MLAQSCAPDAAGSIICTMSKESDNKHRVSPLALIAVGLVLIAIVTFAVLQKKQQANEEVASQPAATEQPSTPAEPQQPQQEQPAPTAAPASVDFRMPPFLTDVQVANLQATKDPTTVNPGAMAAYQVARQKPKLLAQLPCFCYCDRFGHGSLHDCYVTDHAESCDICLKEALQADQMDQQGIPINQIRDAIVAQFHPRDSEHAH